MGSILKRVRRAGEIRSRYTRSLMFSGRLFSCRIVKGSTASRSSSEMEIAPKSGRTCSGCFLTRKYLSIKLNGIIRDMKFVRKIHDWAKNEFKDAHVGVGQGS